MAQITEIGAQFTQIGAAGSNGLVPPIPSAAPAATYSGFQGARATSQGQRKGVHRTFRPARGRFGLPASDFPPSRLVRYSPKYQYSRLFHFPYHGAHFQPRMNSIVIQVQGISSINDSSNTNSAAAVGVYFGPKCPRNSFYPLPIQYRQTNNRAVLESIRCALEHVMMMRNTEFWPGWKEVIIMTNSDYAKTSLSRWVWQWEKNNWTKAGKKQAVENVEAMQVLHSLLTFIEGALNMSVKFWKVERDNIAGADELAQMALASQARISLE